MAVAKKISAKKTVKFKKVSVTRVHPTKEELARATKTAISKYRVAVKKLAKR